MFNHAPQPVSLHFLGVEFRLNHWQKTSSKIAQGKLSKIQHHLTTSYESAIRRQGRTRCTYVDVLTDVHCGSTADLAGNDIYLLAADLSCGIAQKCISPNMILELARFSPIKTMQQTFRFNPGNQSALGVITIPDLTIEQINITPSDRQQNQQDQIQRHLIINLDEHASAECEINWNELAILAALAHLKCDIEVMIDTGFLPIRMCERERCHAFYRPSHMAGRSRFCSDTCRACAPREQGKKQEKYSSK